MGDPGPVADLGVEGRLWTTAEEQRESTSNAEVVIGSEKGFLQASQSAVGGDNSMLTSEITSPAPFPSGTAPNTLVTAPPPPPSAATPAAATTSSSSPAVALRSLTSSPPSSSHRHPTTPIAAESSSTGTTTTTLPDDTDGGGGADSGLSTAAAAGIGVGSTVGGVLLLVLVGWVVHRRKRLAPTASRAYDRPLKDPAAAEVGGEGSRWH
ncbi:uncharacterized protein PG998_012888 [Apiospora kogelbergensis]|uniref:uncharacterized protein n=1 Tax=Apiospora kogelbergensis TaxID=1337665 RepID=UPI00312DA366